MKIKDLWYLINKRLFEKQNIFLIIILTIIITIIFSCITACYLIYDFKDTAFKNGYKYREIWVISPDKNYDALKDIEHIEYFVNSKFSHTLYANIEEFDTDLTKGEIAIKPIIKKDDIKIVDGTNINNNYEMVCPKNFYPYSESIGLEKTVVHYSKILNGSDYIGKSFMITPEIYEEYEEAKSPVDIKVVGVYESKRNSDTIQTCYVNKETFDYLYTNILQIESWTTAGKEYTNIVYFDDMIVRVDKYENMDKVRSELIQKGFSIQNMTVLDETLLKLIFYIPLFVILIILIVALNLIYSFIKKKSKYRNNYEGILKVSGYTNTDILKLNLLENIIILLISFILSFIIYIIIFTIINKYFLYDFIYNNYSLSMPSIYLILIFILINIIMIAITTTITKKSLKLSIKDKLVL